MREKEERQKPLLKWAGFREIISSYRFMTQDTLHCTPRCTTPCCYFYHFSRVRAAQLLLSLAAQPWQTHCLPFQQRQHGWRKPSSHTVTWCWITFQHHHIPQNFQTLELLVLSDMYIWATFQKNPSHVYCQCSSERCYTGNTFPLPTSQASVAVLLQIQLFPVKAHFQAACSTLTCLSLNQKALETHRIYSKGSS